MSVHVSARSRCILSTTVETARERVLLVGENRYARALLRYGIVIGPLPPSSPPCHDPSALPIIRRSIRYARIADEIVDVLT